MRKLICIFICMLVLIGCSAKKNGGPATDISNQPKIVEDVQNEDVSKPGYDTYSMLLGVKSNEGSWYYDVPYLNEVQKGYGMLYFHGDNWLLVEVSDILRKNEVGSLEEARDVALEMFFESIDGYFYKDEKGFVEISSNYETHSGIEMLKIEGSATDAKYKSLGEYWIYGYVFIIEGETVALMGMNDKDKTEETKDVIRTYVDGMANSVVFKSWKK